MIVFAVQWSWIECGGVSGVYSTRELAQLAIGNGRPEYYYQIIEIELDGELVVV
jgi:hypothetical protein